MKPLIHSALAAVHFKSVKSVAIVGLVLTAGISSAQSQFSLMWKSGAVGVSFSMCPDLTNWNSKSDFKKYERTIDYRHQDEFHDFQPAGNGFYANEFATTPAINSFGIAKELRKPGSRFVGTAGLSFNMLTTRGEFMNAAIQGGEFSNYELRIKEKSTQLGISYKQEVLILNPESKFNIGLSAGLRWGVGLSSRVMVYGKATSNQNTVEKFTDNGKSQAMSSIGANAALGLQYRFSPMLTLKLSGQMLTNRYYKNDNNWHRTGAVPNGEIAIFFSPKG